MDYNSLTNNDDISVKVELLDEEFKTSFPHIVNIPHDLRVNKNMDYFIKEEKMEREFVEVGIIEAEDPIKEKLDTNFCSVGYEKQIAINESYVKGGDEGSDNGRRRTRDDYRIKKKKLICEECGKACSCLYNLKEHLRTHTGDKPFICDQCDQSFSRGRDLKKHLTVHTNAKPFTCDLCGQTFSRREYLKRHQKVHNSNKPFQCNYCSGTFRERGTLKVHLRIHTGEKPYHCRECGHSFRDKGSLRKHSRIHSGQRPYKCDQCAHSFNQNVHLKKHLNTHTKEKKC